MAVSRSLGQLTIDLVARVGGWTSGLDKAERELKTRTSRMDRQIKAFRNTLTAAFAAIGVGALVRSIVTETAAAERSLAQLDATLKSTGNAAGYSREQLVRMADDLSNSSVFRSGDIIDAQSRLLTYTGIVGENLPRAMQAVVDYAAKFNVSLIQAAETVGKAVERPLKGMASLSKQGFYLTESQQKLARDLEAAGRAGESQALVLDMLEESTKGAAEATRNTFGGALQAVGNNFRDLLTAKDGLPEATAAVNAFAETLKDPEIVDAANTITSALIRMGAAATKAAAGGINTLGDMADGLAVMVAGWTGNLSEADKLERKLKDLDRAISGDFFDRTPAQLFRSIESLRAERLAAEEQLKALEARQGFSRFGGTGENTVLRPQTGGASTAPAAPPPPTEEFLKLEESLKQQVALYGSVGEAAKVAYQIQSGQLDELSDKEQQRVLALAHQYDSVVEAAKATQEREQAEARLIQTFDQQVATYERQIALTGEITELERVRYELANGGLAGLNDAQRERLELLAEEVDRIQQAAKAQAERESILNEGKALMESLQTPLEQYQSSIERFNELRSQRAISEETYIRAVIDAQDKLRDATEETNQFMEGLAKNTEGLLANTLFGAMEGKIDNIGKAFARMVKQMLADALAANLAKSLFGEGGGFGGGFIGSLFGGGRALGGPVAAGTMYEINERGDPEMLNVGGRQYLMMGKQAGQVTPLGAGAASVQVSIENYGTSKGFEVQRVSDEQIRIIAKDEVSRGAPSVIASQLENPNSRVSKAVSRNTTAARQRS